MDKILQLRKEIDDIDNQIIDLLIKRINICKLVGVVKQNNSINIEHPNRENEILQRLNNKSSLPAELINSIYQEIFNISKNIQITNLKSN
jgi:chorismate mutase